MSAETQAPVSAILQAGDPASRDLFPGDASDKPLQDIKTFWGLVLTSSRAVELFNQLQQAMGALARQGVVKRNEASAQNAASAS